MWIRSGRTKWERSFKSAVTFSPQIGYVVSPSQHFATLQWGSQQSYDDDKVSDLWIETQLEASWYLRRQGIKDKSWASSLADLVEIISDDLDDTLFALVSVRSHIYIDLRLLF